MKFKNFLSKRVEISEISNFKKDTFDGYDYENGKKIITKVKGYTFNIDGFGKYDDLLYGIFKRGSHWIMIDVNSGFKIAEDYLSNRTKIIKKGLSIIKNHLKNETNI